MFSMSSVAHPLHKVHLCQGPTLNSNISDKDQKSSGCVFMHCKGFFGMQTMNAVKAFL